MDEIVGGYERPDMDVYDSGSNTFETIKLTQEPNNTCGVSIDNLNRDKLLDIAKLHQ